MSLLSSDRFKKINEEIKSTMFDSPYWRRREKEKKREFIIDCIIGAVVVILIFLYAYGVSYAYHNAESQEEKDRILHNVEKGIWMGTGRGVIIYDERGSK